MGTSKACGLLKTMAAVAGEPAGVIIGLCLSEGDESPPSSFAGTTPSPSRSSLDYPPLSEKLEGAIGPPPRTRTHSGIPSSCIAQELRCGREGMA